MTDQMTPSSFDQTDSGLRPAASLTSIPVRRRRKDGGSFIPSPGKAKKPRNEAAAEPASVAAKPEKPTFGKLRQPKVERPVEPQTAVPLAGMADAEPDATETVEAAARKPSDDGAAALAPEGIISLWEQLAGDAPFPALIDLDVGRVAAHWPNSLLLRAAGNPKRPEVEVARIFSADPAHNIAPLPIDTMTIDWMMALAREVTHDGVPVHELDNVSADDPSVEYGVIALPFGNDPDTVDHVLCHLYRYEGLPEEETPVREPKERALAGKSGRRMMANIFGRRQTAPG